jgi:peptidoglycan/xylan/chitin deacetylase (PgdA/CDA1 family)
MGDKQARMCMVRAQLARAVQGRMLHLAFAAVAVGWILTSPAYATWEIPQYRNSLFLSRAGSQWQPASPVATPVPLPEDVKVPILMYHYISELPPHADAYRRDLTVTPDKFEAQLQYLVEEGYHAVTLTDVYQFLAVGQPLFEKSVVLSFDDGYRDAYEVAFPLLLDYGFSGTFFVLATPAHFEWEDYLTWDQMLEMSDAGMDIQAHGRDHVDLRGRSWDYLLYQVKGAQEAIDYHTGRLPRFFCYPSGRRDARVIKALEEAGYWGAVTTEWGRVHTRGGLYEMPRIRVRGQDDLATFVERLKG